MGFSIKGILMRLHSLALFLALPLFAQAPKPRVVFTTNQGSFTLELEPEAAPKTVANFLKYVRSGHYKYTTFHRVIPGFMIQGGGHLKDLKEKSAKDRVINEADISLAKGVRNSTGTVAMARTGDPHSASAQFFINTVDNGFLDHRSKDARGWGYCAFGRVVSGMETVEKIKAVKTRTQTGPLGPMEAVPVTPVIILKAEELKAAGKATPKKAPSEKKAPAKKKPAMPKAA